MGKFGDKMGKSGAEMDKFGDKMGNFVCEMSWRELFRGETYVKHSRTLTLV